MKGNSTLTRLGQEYVNDRLNPKRAIQKLLRESEAQVQEEKAKRIPVTKSVTFVITFFGCLAAILVALSAAYWITR